MRRRLRRRIAKGTDDADPALGQIRAANAATARGLLPQCNLTDHGLRNRKPTARYEDDKWVHGGFGLGQDRYDPDFDPDGRDERKKRERKCQR